MEESISENLLSWRILGSYQRAAQGSVTPDKSLQRSVAMKCSAAGVDASCSWIYRAPACWPVCVPSLNSNVRPHL